MTARHAWKWMALVMACALSACSSAPVRRVSEPAARIQQLTVRTDGSWSLDLRIENFSSIPMRIDRIDLALSIGSYAAGALTAQPGLTIGPESADVQTVLLRPATEAKLAVADALASHRGVDYTLHGTIDATPEDVHARTFEIDRSSALTPAPGLPGVLR